MLFIYSVWSVNMDTMLNRRGYNKCILAWPIEPLCYTHGDHISLETRLDIYSRPFFRRENADAKKPSETNAEKISMFMDYFYLYTGLACVPVTIGLGGSLSACLTRHRDDIAP